MKPTPSLGYTFAESNPHWLYDLSIANVEERKEKRMYFEAAHKLANYIGLPPKEIYDKRVIGTKVFSKRFQRWYVIRIATKQNPNERKDSTC